MGYQVTVYDRHDRAGGLMIYGIPGLAGKACGRAPQRPAGRRRRRIRPERQCRRDISFDAIRGKHDAVLIATGVYKTRDLDIDNAAARGVVRALDYLTASNRVDLGDGSRITGTAN